MAYAQWAAAALTGAKRLADLAALLDKVPADQRARAQAWVADLQRSRSLEQRVQRTVALADDLGPGADTVEQKEACERYARRARALAQALAIANEQRGRDRSRERARVKQAAGELQAEMVAFLLQRGAVTGSDR